MAVVASDLLSKNGGQLPASLFGDATDAEVLAQLDAYLDAGYAKAAADGIDAADEDDAVKAWAYHRAFDDKVIEMSASPMSSTVESEGSASFTSAQIETFITKAIEWRGAYDALVPVLEEPDAGWTKVHGLR